MKQVVRWTPTARRLWLVPDSVNTRPQLNHLARVEHHAEEQEEREKAREVPSAGCMI